MKKRWLCGLLAVVMLLTTLSGMPLKVSAASSMSASDELIAVLKKMEGFNKYPYWDNTQWTVGYGTRCPDDKLDEYKANGITEAQAEALLAEQMKSFVKSVNNLIDTYDLKLNQNQFDALVSFTYNCGAAWMKDTTSYLHKAIREGDMGNGFIYGISLYSVAGGNYILMKRRMCEANMYINGVYKAYNSGANAYPSTYKWVFLDGNGGALRFSIQGYDAADPVSIIANFSSIPTGVDENGKSFVYELEGWYTSSGSKVELLDGSLADGTVLYAKWKDPSGNVVSLPKGTVVNPVKVTVTGDRVNVRSGPGTFYSVATSATKGDTLTVTEIFESGDYTWGKTELGWISLGYTNYDEVSKEAEGDQNFPKSGTVNSTGVYYRTEPVISPDTVVGQKTNGDRVEITEEYYDGTRWWGKMTDGNWIALSYVTYDSDAQAQRTVTGIALLKTPDKTQYIQMWENLSLDGSLLQVSYSDGSTTAMTLTESQVSGFSNKKLGEVTVTVTHSGFTDSFTVNIVKATVTFKNWDGTVLSATQYAYGETVQQPEVPAREGYVFAGWDKKVTTCAGNAVYTAVFVEEGQGTETTVPDSTTGTEPGGTTAPTEPTVPGDIDDNTVVDEDDAIYLLRHAIFPEDYPINVAADFNADGVVNEDDAIYLLRYVIFPEDYPLNVSGNEN